MFFSKKEDNAPKRFVVVLGTSPLARFLTCILQENNIEVAVLSLSKEEKDSKAETCVLKNGVQNRSFSFNVCNFLTKKPECCFLASSFNEYKSDLLLLHDELLRDVKVVNFASFYNHKIIEQMTQVHEVRAYFNGWLVKNKKELILLNKSPEILLCEEAACKQIQSLINDKKTDVKECKSKKVQKMFWQKKATWLLGNLLVLAYNESVSEMLLDYEKRKKTDELIKEIAQLALKEEVQIDTQMLLSDIYVIPDKFLSEYNSMQGCRVLIEMLGNVDCFEHPNLSEVIRNISKKY